MPSGSEDSCSMGSTESSGHLGPDLMAGDHRDDDHREAALGFKPQKEIIYNRHLPYSEKLDKEANTILADIKSGLAQAVQLRDLGVGAVHWSGQLSKYLQLYGRRFSKRDHILLIDLMYELIVMPTLELSWVQRYGNLLVALLKKKELLNREELEIRWRPLYELVERTLYCPYELHGLQLIPFNLETTLKKVIKVCRPYFSLASTEEMLDEWRPLMCPYDTSMIKGMKYCEMFLNTDLPPEHHDKGFKLWFDEFIHLLDGAGDSSPFSGSIKILLARLSNRNIGYIDWSPYMRRIFDSLLQSMDLPVGGLMSVSGNGVNPLTMLIRDYSSANWLISLLGGGRNTQKYLNDFLKATETYFHPSNTGKWTISLMDLLSKLCQALVNRIDRERSPHRTWIHPIPDNYRLKSSEVTEFVLGMKNVAFLAIFSKRGQREATQVIQHLASLRPELIIPPLLETAYPAMENLTEPHRLLSCMTCLTAVSRMLMQNNRYYSSGRQHVIPLLYLALPGIDANDTTKSWTAMQMISTFLGLVPLVDCSQAHQYYDLSEEDLELCRSTAQFEDFALLLLERLIGLIESYSQDGNPHHGQATDSRQLSHDENLMQKFISSTFNALVQQSSPEIFGVIRDKLFSHVTTSIYDIRVAGNYFGTMLKSLAKSRPKEVMAKFLPHFHRTIMSHNTEATRKAENLDGELLWSMVMLSDLVCCDGREVLPYISKITEILDFVLKLEAKNGYEIGSSILEHLLVVLLNTYLVEYRSVTDINRSLSEYLPIRDWGLPGDLRNANPRWHIASDEEKEAATELLKRYLVPQLGRVKNIASGTVSSTREETLRCLEIINSCVRGFSAAVDAWEGSEVPLVESQTSLFRHRQVIRESGDSLSVNGENPRMLVATSVRPLLDKMLNSHEDDTKSLLKLIDIYHHVVMFNGTTKDEFDLRWKSFHLFKKLMQNKLLGKKKHVRSLLLHRVQLQHDLRISNKDAKIFTELHRDMFLDLYRLSCSLYPEVRKKAQTVLNIGVSVFAYSSRVLIPSIVQSCSKSNDVQHHEFKGALYVLLGDRSKPRLAASKYWKPLLELWPVIVQADHSEKPSILALIDRLVDRIHRQFESPSIERITSDAVLNNAVALWNSTSEPKCMWTKASLEQIEGGRRTEAKNNAEAKEDYNRLIVSLVELIEGGKLHWKFHELALELIALLLRHDTEIPARVVQLYTQSLVHDSLIVRKLAINGMMAVVKSQKRRAPRLEIPREQLKLIDGKPDNDWLKLDPKFVMTPEIYNTTPFVDKTHWGFYAWPAMLKYHAPAPQQPSVKRSFNELSEAEKPIYTRFMDKAFIDKLFECLCLEEQKGSDRFCSKRAAVFKGLFRNFGSEILVHVKPHVERLIATTDPAHHESSQRVAAEVLSGLVRGSKHWLYEDVDTMWTWCVPQLERVLNSLTVENISFWAKFFELCSESRDPKRLKPMMKLVMHSPLRGDGGSFGDSGRMRLLQAFLTQQEWRVPCYQDAVLTIVKEHLNHPYKNVRDRLASFMTTIFICDRRNERGSKLASPKQEEFLKDLEPDLSYMCDAVKKLEGQKVESASEDWKSRQRSCKTLFSWLRESFQRMTCNVTPDVYQLLPLLCILVSDCDDEELKGIVSQVLKYLPRTQVHEDNVPVLLDTMTEISEFKSWHARVALLKFIQSHVFYNLFTLEKPETRLAVKNLVLKLLRDEHLEVRELAAVTFGGLLQCGYFDFTPELLDHFEKLSGDKKRKRRRALKEPLSTEDLIKRHAGILGLCSCVLAYPYDVPDFVPAILVDLSSHLDDPQPIQLTVKKALSNFRRTHHDNWLEHKEKFTDDQLVILTDLLVSPNYYA